MTESLDRRVHAYRDGLADTRLKGRVSASRFVEGSLRRVVANSTPLRLERRSDAPVSTELLRGEVVRVFDDSEGWSWGQNETDGYVGYLSGDALGPIAPEPTHCISTPRTFIYPGPDMKLPPRGWLSFGARVALAGRAETRGTEYRLLAGGEGAVVASTARPLEAPPAADYVAVAELFLGVPYLWGGRTSLGLDCSALVQLSLAAAGHPAPRDTDMQAASIGEPIPAEAPVQRGDLIFWPGHVAIARSADEVIHASGFHTAVIVEPLRTAIARIGKPAIRRP